MEIHARQKGVCHSYCAPVEPCLDVIPQVKGTLYIHRRNETRLLLRMHEVELHVQVPLLRTRSILHGLTSILRALSGKIATWKEGSELIQRKCFGVLAQSTQFQRP